MLRLELNFYFKACLPFFKSKIQFATFFELAFYPLLGGFNIWRAVHDLQMLLPSGGDGAILRYRSSVLLRIWECWINVQQTLNRFSKSTMLYCKNFW